MSEMIQFINKITGGVMWVAEDRADEYKAAGHKPAASAAEPQKPPKTKTTKTKTKKKQ